MKTKSIKMNAVLNTLTQVSTLLLMLATFPYVTRVLTPDNYGKVAFGNSIISYITIIATLGISTYATREGAAIRNDKTKLDAFCSELFTFNLVSTLAAYIVLFVLMACWKEKADYRLLIAVMSIPILMNTIGMTWIFTIFEEYLFVSIRSIVVLALQVGSVYLFVKSPEDYVIYAIIGTVGSMVTNILNFIYARKLVHIKLVPLKNFKTYFAPIMILFCSQALITIYLSADVTMLEIMRDDAEVGEYEVAVRIYTMMKTILNAVVAVTIPRFAYYFGEKMYDEAEKLKTSTVETLFVLLVPVLVGMIMVSDRIIEIMAGADYTRSVGALQILSIALIFAVLANFFVNGILLVYKKEKMILIGTIASAVLNVGANFFMIPKFGLYGAAITTLLAEMCITVISMVASRKLFPFRTIIKTLLTTMLASLGIVGACLLVGTWNLSLWPDLILKVLISAVIYTGLMLLLRGKHLIEMLKTLR